MERFTRTFVSDKNSTISRLCFGKQIIIRAKWMISQTHNSLLLFLRLVRWEHPETGTVKKLETRISIDLPFRMDGLGGGSGESLLFCERVWPSANRNFGLNFFVGGGSGKAAKMRLHRHFYLPFGVKCVASSLLKSFVLLSLQHASPPFLLLFSCQRLMSANLLNKLKWNFVFLAIISAGRAGV